nr:urease accessory UreF family protein [Kitasatospora kifunensis]
MEALLVGLQLTDSAFPSGRYTLSQGLEGYLQAKQVDQQSMPELLADLLRHSVGPADATALALAHRAATAGDFEAVVAIDQRLHASKLNRELRQACLRTGRQLLDTAQLALGSPMLDRYAELVTARTSPGCQPVAAGVAYAAGGVATEQAVASDLFAFAVGFTGAALRLRLTDHRRAQLTLRATAPVIAEVTALALRRELADLGGFSPLADVMSARHERAEERLFAS